MCPDPLHSTTAIPLGIPLKQKGSVSPEQCTEKSEGPHNPSPSEASPSKGLEWSHTPESRVTEHGTLVSVTHLLTQSYGNRSWVPHVQQRPNRNNTSMGGGDTESFLGKPSPEPPWQCGILRTCARIGPTWRGT